MAGGVGVVGVGGGGGAFDEFLLGRGVCCQGRRHWIDFRLFCGRKILSYDEV